MEHKYIFITNSKFLICKQYNINKKLHDFKDCNFQDKNNNPWYNRNYHNKLQTFRSVRLIINIKRETK